MPDLIRLLPDSVANQIAAGEVVQRPASVVKELMENAIDSGATEVQLFIKDAGKTLVQVVDNGCGMSETDARMSFERHSTSKIADANDLFAIRTMGFRGEALASIAAVAQVELKTKKKDDVLGSKLIIEGSEVKEQTVCQTTDGSSFSIKNLFFNIPARRKFMKSNKVETYHIITEFQRVALAHPEISFTMHQNNKLLFNLERLPLKQRIVNLIGNKAKEMLIPVEQETDIVKINGFIAKPEFAKRRRGEQYFFVNNRFMRHPLFHRFIENAFEGLIAHEAFPTYFIYFDINPEKIDVNIHPTKTEIKFVDEQVIGATLRAAVRLAIGKFNILPSLDFEVEKSFENIPKADAKDIKPPSIKVNPNFNPFESGYNTPANTKNRENIKNWEKLFGDKNPESGFETETTERQTQQIINPEWDKENSQQEKSQFFQVHNRYIYSQIKSGIMVIDQQLAHERILYEKFLKQLTNKSKSTQGSLFPREIELSQHEIQIINSLQNELKLLGLDVKITGDTTLMINGIPSDFSDKDPETLIQKAIESYSLNSDQLEIDMKTNLAISLAKNLSIKPGKTLSKEEMQMIIDKLFACEMPYASPLGKKVFYTITMEEMQRNLN